jgi:phosphoenolpyruvate carboxykinase (ATP)
MSQHLDAASHRDLRYLGFTSSPKAHFNLSPQDLTNITVEKGMGRLTDNGTLAINTGKFTGRSPKDRFIVKDDKTEKDVWWGDINIPFEKQKFLDLRRKIIAYMEDKELYIRDAFACDHPEYRLNVRVVAELPWSSLFAYNMFLRPNAEELESFTPQWHVLCAPGFKADPSIDGTRQDNFAIVDFTERCIIIGGTGYTGEIKKGIFSVLNFVLPHDHKVLSMHCSANVGEEDDTAVFFGLSGTGKTTLSSDENRRLIGDDEHGWAKDTVFNFEGGCYAKTINLDPEGEPQIFQAIKPGALLENIGFKEGTNEVDFTDASITENTRVSYPIYHIENIMHPSSGSNVKNIFFLTADAFGTLPPISKLTKGQAMYYFISGYTAKVAGTEAGVTEPVAAFSACFGAPFMPLHPTVYAEMLGEKMHRGDVKVWLINTGWSGGPYGTGKRIKLKFTRAMITAAMRGELDNVAYAEHPIFGLFMPMECPEVPSDLLNPKQTWADKIAHDNKAQDLANRFRKNFAKFEEHASEEILAAAPKSSIQA